MLLLPPLAFGRKHRPPIPEPNTFVVGRMTHFDFGPPFNYYELYLVQATANGSSIERITLTPPGGSCVQPAQLEDKIATVSQTVQALLGEKNPCSIPEKDIHRELKRCKHCLIFSFATTSIQTQCGTGTRVIRSSVFDKDWFDPEANAPKNTSWSMRLLDQLDSAVGPSVMAKPVFPTTAPQAAPAPDQSPGLAEVSVGKYDGLFQGESEKPSDLYRLASKAIPTPDIQIRVDTPVKSPKLAPPIYPPLARIAHVDGIVSVEFVIDKDGRTDSITILSGPQLLRGATIDAVQKWKFAPDPAGQRIHATLKFNSNCSAGK
jgi:TonB family protein